MLAGLLNSFLRHSLVLLAASGILGVSALGVSAYFLSRESESDDDSTGDVLATWADDDQEGEQCPGPGRHRALPRQRVAVAR